MASRLPGVSPTLRGLPRFGRLLLLGLSCAIALAQPAAADPPSLKEAIAAFAPKTQVPLTNGVLSVVYENTTGQFTINTGTSHPRPGQRVLFGGTTSYFTLRDATASVVYINRCGSSPGAGAPGHTVATLCPPVISTLGTTGFRATYTVPNWVVVQDVRINGTTLADTNVMQSITVTNTSSGTRLYGVRNLWDWAVAGADASFFRTRRPDGAFTSTFTTFTNPTFELFEEVDNVTSPTLSIFGTVRGGSLTPAPTAPDQLRYAPWGTAVGAAWDFTNSGSGGDSATAHYWGFAAPLSLGAGQSATFVQYATTQLSAVTTPPPTSSTPGMPTITRVVQGDARATFEFAPPTSPGASAITSYRVSCTPGGATVTGAASPLIVTGLTNGQSYSCTVTATNSFGAGTPSLPATASPVAPPFPMTVQSNITTTTATASASISYRPADVGTVQSVYVFAMAPASRVIGASSADVMKLGFAKDEKKADTPIGCVLAQLNAAGQLVAVSSANLAAYLTGVLSAQGASVSILNGLPVSNVSGATFFVGYGTSGTQMINTGNNRPTVTVPGSLVCSPQVPQTGWWWNPAEDGRGFSLEIRGNNLFFASFLYETSGRSTWLVSSGPVSLDGTLYNGDLYSAANGQTLDGSYRAPTLTNIGRLNLTFNNGLNGTLVWPGGTVPIQRFNIVANGLNAAPAPGQPQSGWWWNAAEPGRGFFLEFQGGWLDIAGFMYNLAGEPVWYLTVAQIGGTEQRRSFSSSWWSFINGQPLHGAWRPNARNDSNVAPLTIDFTSSETAVMTLPGGRTTALTRHAF